MEWECQTRSGWKQSRRCDRPVQVIIQFQDGDTPVIEWRSPDGNFIADVAVFRGQKLLCVFEVLHTHRTEENGYRPEPWFEVEASDILAILPDVDKQDAVPLMCAREQEAVGRECTACRIKQQTWTKDIPRLNHHCGSATMWRQEMACICCGRENYSPDWWPAKGPGGPGGPRAICKFCTAKGEDVLRPLLLSRRKGAGK